MDGKPQAASRVCNQDENNEVGTIECGATRVSFNGRTLASQANNVGSIPITRSILA